MTDADEFPNLTPEEIAELEAGDSKPASAAPRPEDLVPKVRRNHEIKPGPPPKWLGPGWLPRGHIAVLVGEEGIGKSLLWVLIASHVTNGTAFEPFNIPAREPADVLIIVTEDSAAEVRERLKLAGTDMSRILWYSIDEDGTGSPVFGPYIEGDFARLDAYLDSAAEKPAMVVVDAWLDTVAANLNVRDGQQARQAMHPWSTLAGRYGFMTLLVTHTNRLDTSNTRDLMGATAVLRHKARMVLFSARPRNAEEPVIYVGPDKANNTGLINAVRFHVQPRQVREKTDDDPGTTAYLVRPNYTTDTMSGHIAAWKQQEIEAKREPTVADSAEQDLRSYMDGLDSVLVSDLEDHLRDLGYGKTAIEKAKKASGKAVPGGKGEPWIFKLHESSVPSVTSVPSLPTYREGLGTLENPGDSKSPYTPPVSQETSKSRETRDTYGEKPPADSVDSVDYVATPEAVEEQPASPQWGVNPNAVELDLGIPEAAPLSPKDIGHREEILAHLIEHGPADRKTLAEATHKAPEATSSTLTRAVRKEYVLKQEDGLYGVTEAGREYLADKLRGIAS